jgi:hypothetical protein
MTKNPSHDPDYATSEEVADAFGALTDAELRRLGKFAEAYIWGTEYTDPLELIDEAVKRTLIGAEGVEKGRRWPKTVAFMAFMVKTMESIADGSRESVVQKETDHLEVLAGEDGDSEHVLGKGGHKHLDVVEAAIELEETQARQAAAKADADLIERHFADDQEVLAIIEGEKEGWKAEETRQAFDMTPTAYDTARRRLRRGLNKLMPGRTKS